MEWADRIGRRLKLRDIHIALTVARSGSMLRAADQLAISQPVVSKVIADLEHTVGVRLFDRGRKGAELTVYGRALLARGLAAFDELRQGVQDIEFLLDPAVGEVRMGATEPIIAGLLPTIIDRLSRHHPGLRFNVVRSQTDLQQYRSLRERDVEFVVGRISQPFPEGDLAAEVLFDEPLLVAAGTRSRWARRSKIAIAELVDEPWVLPQPDQFIGALAAELFRSHGLELPKNGVVCSSLQMNDALLATGRYLAVYSGSLLRLSAKRLGIKALPVELRIGSTPVGIVTPKSRTLSPRARLFIDCAREMAGSLGLSRADISRKRMATKAVR